MEFVADLDSLKEFFGAEPELEYPDLEYHSNCVTFDLQLGDNTVWFKFVPSQAFGELRLGGKPFRITKLLFSNLTHLAVRKTKEDHYLLLKFAEPNVNDFTLHLRPNLLAFWGNQGARDEDA